MTNPKIVFIPDPVFWSKQEDIIFDCYSANDGSIVIEIKRKTHIENHKTYLVSLSLTNYS